MIHYLKDTPMHTMNVAAEIAVDAENIMIIVQSKDGTNSVFHSGLKDRYSVIGRLSTLIHFLHHDELGEKIT